MRIQTHIHTYRKPTQDNVGSVYMKLSYLDKSSVTTHKVWSSTVIFS